MYCCIKYPGCLTFTIMMIYALGDKSVVVSTLLQQAFHHYHADLLLESLLDPVAAQQQSHMSVIQTNDIVFA